MEAANSTVVSFLNIGFMRISSYCSKDRAPRYVSLSDCRSGGLVVRAKDHPGLLGMINERIAVALPQVHDGVSPAFKVVDGLFVPVL